MRMLLNILVCVVAASAFLSCDKDEVALESIAGQWKLTDVHADDGVATISGGGVETSYTYSFVGKDYTAVSTFTENPNTFSTTGSYTVVFTADYGGGATQTFEIEAPAFVGEGTWEIDGSILRQTFDGQEVVPVNILEISSTTMRFRMDQDATVVDGGITTHSTATVFATFERL